MMMENKAVMLEASIFMPDPHLRELFCTPLLYCLSNELPTFWDKWENRLAEDILKSPL